MRIIKQGRGFYLKNLLRADIGSVFQMELSSSLVNSPRWISLNYTFSSKEGILFFGRLLWSYKVYLKLEKGVSVFGFLSLQLSRWFELHSLNRITPKTMKYLGSQMSLFHSNWFLEVYLPSLHRNLKSTVKETPSRGQNENTLKIGAQ